MQAVWGGRPLRWCLLLLKMLDNHAAMTPHASPCPRPALVLQTTWLSSSYLCCKAVISRSSPGCGMCFALARRMAQQDANVATLCARFSPCRNSHAVTGLT